MFLDPPYGKGLAEKALASARDGGWLTPDALIVVEEAKGAFARPTASRRSSGATTTTRSSCSMLGEPITDRHTRVSSLRFARPEDINHRRPNSRSISVSFSST